MGPEGCGGRGLGSCRQRGLSGGGTQGAGVWVRGGVWLQGMVVKKSSLEVIRGSGEVISRVSGSGLVGRVVSRRQGARGR